MKKEMKLAAMLMTALFAMVLGSCTSDEVSPKSSTQEPEEWHTVQVNMNVSKCEFDTSDSRAVGSGTGWEDKDIIYLLFSDANGNKIKGNATYDKATTTWKLQYFGTTLPHIENGTLQAYFFDGYTNLENDIINIQGTTGVYMSLSGSYSFPIGGSVTVVATLRAATSRIRFKGNYGTSIRVGGIKYYTSQTRSTGEMTQSMDVVSLTVGSNGYTSYIYGEFANETTPAFVVENSNSIFVAEWSSPTSIFQKGQSGWMNIPSTNNSDGWVTLSGTASVTINKEQIAIEEGKYTDLTTTILPDDTYKVLAWSSSDNSVATVDNFGRVTALAPGKTTITATSYLDGTKTAKCSVVVEPTHTGVNLGLPSGTLWATCNVGASSPEDYGYYYAWGETEPKKSYTQINYTYSATANLPLINDAAYTNWGNNWKMPTKDQEEELRDKCSWQWSKQNGIVGYKVTGPNGNSIFLPAAGYYNNSSVSDTGKSIYCWSCTYSGYNSTNKYNEAYAITYETANKCKIGNYNAFIGRSVRAVRLD